MTGTAIEWMMTSAEPWTRLQALMTFGGLSPDAGKVQDAKVALLIEPRVQELIGVARGWPTSVMKRHNDAGHPLYALLALTDFGLNGSDPGMYGLAEMLLEKQSQAGPFQSRLQIGRAYGGTDDASWGWMACDAPLLLYLVGKLGMPENDAPCERARMHLLSQADEYGWPCSCSPELGSFRGPGRKGDHCPLATLLALKALSASSHEEDEAVCQRGAEVLLRQWSDRTTRHYLFGMGTTFRRLKYPLIWYDLLHVTDVLSHFPFVRRDDRFQEMVRVVAAQADDHGRFTAGSMYQSWKGWSFGDKRIPSPWLTFVTLRMLQRSAM
jgi:hypothetical protein